MEWQRIYKANDWVGSERFFIFTTNDGNVIQRKRKDFVYAKGDRGVSQTNQNLLFHHHHHWWL